MKRTRLRPRSPKRARQMAVYVPRMLAFLAARPWCEFPLGCGMRSTVLHHRRGREGVRLLQEEWWAASCAFHNDYAETETGAALDCGWLVRAAGTSADRLGAA